MKIVKLKSFLQVTRDADLCNFIAKVILLENPNIRRTFHYIISCTAFFLKLLLQKIKYTHRYVHFFLACCDHPQSILKKQSWGFYLKWVYSRSTQYIEKKKKRKRKKRNNKLILRWLTITSTTQLLTYWEPNDIHVHLLYSIPDGIK